MDFSDPAKAIISGAATLFDFVKARFALDDPDLASFIGFKWEVVCLILHLEDRHLSGLTSHSKRFDIVEDLFVAICQQEISIFRKIRYEVDADEVDQRLRDLFNKRTLEYGSMGAEWFSRVLLQFGRHAARALTLTEHKTIEAALLISSLGSGLYRDLLPQLDPISQAAISEQ